MTHTLDERLDSSAPATTAPTADRAEALRHLISATGPRRRTRLRAGAAVAGGLALLGVGSVAAADAWGWTSWWADDAVSEVTYTLPSGAVCEGILGNFRGAAEEVQAAEEFMAQPDLLDRVDVETHYADARAANYVAILDDGIEVDAGPGTPYWSADDRYAQAVGLATSDALHDHLRDVGVLERLSYEAESRCPGLVPAELRSREIRSDW
ncbi:hypothetical protein [Demequina activiva]|uniref:Uncharacterized protein n=1 Tax=Demequina activiva TaxID=1582364 RepID=A0A919Q465_9MICO|nr:hypothetical protein [Demequina activiva]GIG53540.1 hypothetical protein Dac01nite_02920 [Demequina activiva]